MIDGAALENAPTQTTGRQVGRFVVPRRAGQLATLAALAAIVVVALALRWDRLEYAEFSADQGWVINRALDFVTKGDFPLAGIRSSVGTAQGPVEVWLLAIPVAISRDPRVATGFVGLLQVLAIVGTYLLAGRYFGRAAGLVAAALFAVNPWALQYARKIWTPDMMPLFTVLFFSALFAAIVQRRRYQLALACVWFAVLFLIHPAALVYAPVLGLGILLFWRRLGLRPLLLGVGLSLVLAAPYLYSESQRGFVSFLVYAGVGTAQSRVDLEALKFVTTMASGRFFPMMMGYSLRGSWALPEIGQANDLATALLYLGLAISVLNLILAFVRRRQGAAGDWEKYALLLIWFCLPIAFSTRHSLEFMPHYFIDIYPLQFILIAVGLTGTLRLAGSALRRTLPGLAIPWREATAGVAVVVVLYLGLAQTSYFRTYLDYVERQGPSGPYGVPLLFSQRAVDTVRALRAETGDVPVYIYASLQSIALDYLTRPDISPVEVEPPRVMVLPRDAALGAIAVLASDDSAIIGDNLYNLLDDSGPAIRRLRALGFVELPERAVVGPGNHTYYRFFELPPGKAGEAVAPFTPVPNQPALKDGMRLLGASYPEASKAGEKLRVSLLWQLPNALPRCGLFEFNVFVHLVDTSGREVAGDDQPVLHCEDWSERDLIVSEHELAVPADRAASLMWFDVGSYSRYDRAAVPFVDASGQPTGNAVKIGPVAVRAPAAGAAAQIGSDYAFGDVLQLKGYDIAPSAPVVGGKLDVTLHWQARGRMAENYVVSVQLLDESGKLVAQHDSPPVNGNYPTPYWAAGEEVADAHAIALPQDGRPGTYRLAVVVYSSRDQARLPVTLPGGATTDNAPLGNVTLANAPGRQP